MPDQKITVTDEMVTAALNAANEYGRDGGWLTSAGLCRTAITAALDAAPTTDPAHDIDWQEIAERHEDTIKALVAERDEAIAHDRQPYPTAHAYEAACAALAEQRTRAEKAEQERSNLERLVGHTEIRAREAEQGLSDLSERYREQGGALLRAESLTSREHLDAAWEAAHVPEDGIIPAGALHIRRDGRGTIYGPTSRKVTLDADGPGEGRRLMDPPTPKRPEGAAELEDLIREANREGEGTAGSLADRLASRGVRVVTKEDAR